MHFLLKVYTVDNESALSKYIPFAATKIVQYDDYSIPSELHGPILVSLNRLKAKVLFYVLHNIKLANNCFCLFRHFSYSSLD
jgi:endoribonuclease Dicer